MAGLAAAVALKKQGVQDVMVLEASDGVGGRSGGITVLIEIG